MTVSRYWFDLIFSLFSLDWGSFLSVSDPLVILIFVLDWGSFRSIGDHLLVILIFLSDWGSFRSIGDHLLVILIFLLDWGSFRSISDHLLVILIFLLDWGSFRSISDHLLVILIFLWLDADQCSCRCGGTVNCCTSFTYGNWKPVHCHLLAENLRQSWWQFTENISVSTRLMEEVTSRQVQHHTW